MKYTVRALLAVTLLVGFYLFCAAIVLGLLVGVVELIAHDVGGLLTGKFAVIAIVVALAVVRGLFRRRKHTDADPGGLPVSEADQPALWAEVRSVAERAGTRAPDEIRLVADVNAAVTEHSRLLGLLPGPRRLFVGVPLLAGLTALQLRSVLAHEMGHYSGRHTALGGVVYRGMEAIARVRGELGPDSLIGRLVGLYGRLYHAVTNTVNRRQELEADRLSAELVGPGTASEALRRVEPLAAAWQFFLEHYVSQATPSAPGRTASSRVSPRSSATRSGSGSSWSSPSSRTTSHARSTTPTRP